MGEAVLQEDILPIFRLFRLAIILLQEEKIMNRGCMKICGIKLETLKKVLQKYRSTGTLSIFVFTEVLEHICCKSVQHNNCFRLQLVFEER